MASSRRLAALAILAGLAGCTGSSSSAPPAPSTTVGASTTTQPELIAFGATETAWDANHTADPSQDPTKYFVPVVTSAGRPSDEFEDVSYTGGRVTSYSLEMPDGQTLASAKAFIATQLPTDAAVVSTYHSTFADGGTCLFLNYRSPTLAAALGAPPIGDTSGEAAVELFTVTAAGDESLDGSNVNSATISDVANTSAIGC